MSTQKQPPNMMRYAGLATQWMVMLLLAVWGGYKLDQLVGPRFHVCVVLFPVLALGVSLWQLIREFNKPKE